MAEQKHNRRVAIAFSKGYKKGYTDHADKEYTLAMFKMWKIHVADKTEKGACFNGHARKPIKVVE